MFIASICHVSVVYNIIVHNVLVQNLEPRDCSHVISKFFERQCSQKKKRKTTVTRILTKIQLQILLQLSVQAFYSPDRYFALGYFQLVMVPHGKIVVHQIHLCFWFKKQTN